MKVMDYSWKVEEIGDRGNFFVAILCNENLEEMRYNYESLKLAYDKVLDHPENYVTNNAWFYDLQKYEEGLDLLCRAYEEDYDLQKYEEGSDLLHRAYEEYDDNCYCDSGLRNDYYIKREAIKAAVMTVKYLDMSMVSEESLRDLGFVFA